MPNITYDCNAGVERVFIASPAAGPRVNLSRHADYDLFFFIDAPGTSNEKRRLVVEEKALPNRQFTIELNNNGGQKPTQNNMAIHRPRDLRRHRYGVESDPDTERVFFVDGNLTNDQGVVATLNIELRAEGSEDDRKRFLRIVSTGIASFLPGQVDINLNGNGGKKPLGGGQFVLIGGEVITLEEEAELVKTQEPAESYEAPKG